MVRSVSSSRIARVTDSLMSYRRGKWKQSKAGFWDWLEESGGKPATKRNANKFLLGCIIDYQMRAEVAWKNAHRLTESILDDPPELWRKIGSYSKSVWMSKWHVYSVHRFPMGHYRIWRIANEIVQRYDGDARNIWKGQPPDAVKSRLDDLGVGKQISRMVVGALSDTGQIRGNGNVKDVKVDLNVKRVLGRLLIGTPYKQNQDDDVDRMTRSMKPRNPWLLDYPLYSIGKDFCFANRPDCSHCAVRLVCKYFEIHRRTSIAV